MYVCMCIRLYVPKCHSTHCFPFYTYSHIVYSFSARTWGDQTRQVHSSTLLKAMHIYNRNSNRNCRSYQLSNKKAVHWWSTVGRSVREKHATWLEAMYMYNCNSNRDSRGYQVSNKKAVHWLWVEECQREESMLLCLKLCWGSGLLFNLFWLICLCLK